MNADYPITQRLQQLLASAHQAEEKNQSEPEPSEPQPWMWSPIAGMTAPVLAVTTSSHSEEKD